MSIHETPTTTVPGAILADLEIAGRTAFAAGDSKDPADSPAVQVALAMQPGEAAGHGPRWPAVSIAHRGHFERPEPTVITCDGPAGAVCECGDYDDWEYEVCEGCGLPAPEASR